MITLTHVRVFIGMCAVEFIQSVRIAGKSGWHPVEYHLSVLVKGSTICMNSSGRPNREVAAK